MVVGYVQKLWYLMIEELSSLGLKWFHLLPEELFVLQVSVCTKSTFKLCFSQERTGYKSSMLHSRDAWVPKSFLKRWFHVKKKRKKYIREMELHTCKTFTFHFKVSLIPSTWFMDSKVVDMWTITKHNDMEPSLLSTNQFPSQYFKIRQIQ